MIDKVCCGAQVDEWQSDEEKRRTVTRDEGESHGGVNPKEGRWAHTSHIDFLMSPCYVDKITQSLADTARWS